MIHQRNTYDHDFDLKMLYKKLYEQNLSKRMCIENVSVYYHIYPTPPLGQDMTQGQFLSGV